MAQVIGSMCPLFNLAFSLEEARPLVGILHYRLTSTELSHSPPLTLQIPPIAGSTRSILNFCSVRVNSNFPKYSAISRRNLPLLLQGFIMDGGRWSNYFRFGMSIPLNCCHILYDYAKEHLTFFSCDGVVT